MVESYYGRKKFILIYILSAVAASLLSIAMNDSFSIGASGAIFGLLGSLLYFGYHYRVYFGNVLIGRIIPVVIINLGIGFMIPDIDNFAHIGGLVGGFLISKAVGVNSRDKKSDKINGIILSVIYFAFLVFLGIFMR
jgi:rhomboid protease GluP